MNWRFWSGIFGIAFVVLQVVVVGLYASTGAPPAPEESAKLTAYAAKNSSLFLTLAIVAVVSIGCAYVWLLGLRGALRSAGEQHEWAGAFTFGVGLISGAIALVGFGLIAGAALEAGLAKPEPITVRTLFQAANGVFGPLSSLPTALFIAAAAYGTFASGALPRWTGWIGYAAAVLNLAAIPALYGGADPSQFYSAAGFAPIVLGLFPFLIYALATSIVLIRAPK